VLPPILLYFNCKSTLQASKHPFCIQKLLQAAPTQAPCTQALHSSFGQTQSQTQETSICLSSSISHLIGDVCCLFTPLS
jgi:hypothetical protein